MGTINQFDILVEKLYNNVVRGGSNGRKRI